MTKYITPVTEDEKEHHFYQTPLKLAQAALRILPNNLDSIFEPGYGTGIWGKAAREYWPNAFIGGCDIRPEPYDPKNYNYAVSCNYIGARNHLVSGLVKAFVGNPPFKFGQEFVEESFMRCSIGTHILFLLPNNFAHTIKRGKWLWSDKSSLFEEYKIMERPSFKDGVGRDGKIKKGATDIGKEYCLYHFIKGYHGAVTTKAFWWKDV